jgi:hypothetical protein
LKKNAEKTKTQNIKRGRVFFLVFERLLIIYIKAIIIIIFISKRSRVVYLMTREREGKKSIFL